ATSFQSVVELFLLRYHERATSSQLDMEDANGRSERERNYRMLLAYGFDPEFRLAIAKELESDPSMCEWREELGFVMAAETLLARNGAWLYDRIIPPERQGELETVCPEVFGKSKGKALSSVVELLGTIGSPMGSRDQGLAQLASAIDALFPEGLDVPSAMQAFHRHGAFLNLEPSWMQELQDFQRRLAADVGELLKRLGDRPEVDTNQVERLQGQSASVEMIFCIATEATLVRWFRSLPPEDQERVLASSIGLAWGEGALIKAMDRRFAWSKGPAQGARAVMDAAESYRQYGISDAALFIYQALVDDPKVQDRERAEAHNRMAVIHREEGRDRRAFLEFQEAGIIWEALDAKWEGGVTAAFVAEGYLAEGKREKAEKYLEEAFLTFSEASESAEKMARGCLYLAGCADALGRLDLERRALEMGLTFSQSLEDGELFVELNERLIGLPR
ncbi:MAG TPA: hypothetical protein VLU38_05465, partial [Methanomassiliicoccales archaeon]|nr:hypothetical protein [Methanomassiliicoccales archaeon]